MAPEQPELKLGRQLLGNRPRDEPAEAGVDPISVLIRPVGGTLDDRAGSNDLLARAIAQGRVRPIDRNRPNVVDRQVFAGQSDRGAQGHFRPV